MPLMSETESKATLAELGARVRAWRARRGMTRKALAADSGEDTAAIADDRRDLATAVTSVLAAQAGAWAVRVHDVSATRDALRVALSWEGESRWTAQTRSA